MNEGADWNVLQPKRITGLNRGVGTRLNRITDLASSGRQNVAPLSVGIQHKSEMSTPIRVILDTLYATGDTVFVSLEIDDAIVAFVSASLVSRRDATEVIATTRPGLRGQQRGVGLAFVQVVPNGTDNESSAGRGRFGFS